MSLVLEIIFYDIVKRTPEPLGAPLPQKTQREFYRVWASEVKMSLPRAHRGRLLTTIHVQILPPTQLFFVCLH